MLLENAMILDAGYGKEIVGRSANVNQELAEQLVDWAPHVNDLAGGTNESLCYFWLGSERRKTSLVFCRTVVASLPTEFGRRLGAMSRMVLVEPNGLKGYQNNPALFTFHLQLEGYLYFPSNPEDWTKGISQLEIFDSSLPSLRCFGQPAAAAESARVRRAIEIHGNVAVTGVYNSLRFLIGLADDWEPEFRLATRFSIGSLVSANRPFELLLYPECSDQIRRKLVNSQIRTISGGLDVSAKCGALEPSVGSR